MVKKGVTNSLVKPATETCTELYRYLKKKKKIYFHELARASCCSQACAIKLCTILKHKTRLAIVSYNMSRYNIYICIYNYLLLEGVFLYIFPGHTRAAWHTDLVLIFRYCSPPIARNVCRPAGFCLCISTYYYKREQLDHVDVSNCL